MVMVLEAGLLLMLLLLPLLLLLLIHNEVLRYGTVMNVALG